MEGVTLSNDEIIEVVKAHSEGKRIQSREISLREDGKWFSVHPEYSSWNFKRFRYRVAPEPRKPREWTLYDYGNGVSFVAIDGTPCKAVRVREVIE